MRNVFTTAAAMTLLFAAAPAHAVCKDEVLSALDKQRKAAAFRMETNMISENGPVKMTVEYLPPGRMRQVVSIAVDPKPVESILVAGKAWSKEGDTWTPLAEDVAKDMAAQLNETFGDDSGTIGTVACLGSTSIEGQELIAYRVENDAQTGPVDKSTDAAEKARAALADEGRPLRMFYVDPKSGLPMRSVFARANKLDKPIFKAVYTYPADIKIEAPEAK